MNKMFKFNGMPYKRSGRVGGKSVSTIGMLVLLLAALLVLPSCFDDNEAVGPERIICEGEEVESLDDPRCQVTQPPERPVCHATVTPGVPLRGGAPNDVLCGSEGDDTITGGGGDDTITGNGGDDTLLSGDEGDDMIAGGAGDDTINGGPGDDTIDGGEDDDTINGGPGDDTIDGGAGDNDTAVYTRAFPGTIALLPVIANLEAGQAEDGFYGTDTLTGIENLMGGEDPDTFIGDGKDNVLTGGGGDDTLTGGGGGDTLNGGPGADTMDGGGGDDTLNGGLGADTMDGGEGSDTVSYKDSPAKVTVSLVVTGGSVAPGEGASSDALDDVIETTTIQNDDGEDVLVSSIENITGSPFDDGLTGDDYPNIINGGGGVDTINGGGGDDTIYAGAGNDTAVDGDMGNDILKGGPGADTMDGGEGDDRLYGNDDGETAAIDTLKGEGGNDIYFPSISAVDIITEVATGGLEDKVVYFMYYVKPVEGEDPPAPTLTLPANVEVLHGTRYNDTISSNAGGGTLLGHEGDDRFTGMGSNEIFVGCAGNDRYIGGGGDDVFGIVNTGEDSGVDIITDFSDDEIHIKGYDSEVAVTTSVTIGTSQVDLKVGGVQLAVVQPVNDTTYPDGAALKEALDADGVIVFDTMFDATSNQCVSPDPM